MIQLDHICCELFLKTSIISPIIYSALILYSCMCALLNLLTYYLAIICISEQEDLGVIIYRCMIYFYRTTAMLSVVYAVVVCLSVCVCVYVYHNHTTVLYQNG